MNRGASATTVERTVTLPCEPSSAGNARVLLRDVLTGSGRNDWLELAELAVTEIVGNAVLHAHTEITIRVLAGADELRVEVRDANPALPVQRAYDSRATTGRGMALVAALTSAHGVSDAGPEGKTVWFTLADSAVPRSEADLLAAWDDVDWVLEPETGDSADAQRGGAVDTGTSRTVRLLRLPPTLWLAARQHHDALVRELVLYRAEHDGVEVDIPATDRAKATVSIAVSDAVEAAQRAGLANRPVPTGHPSPLDEVPESLDLELDIPGSAAADFGAMQDTLDAAEQLAAADLLLVRPGLPEIVAVRDWACEQITAQLAGVAPAPWPGTDQERFTERGTPTLPHDWDPAPVRGSDRGVVAADDSNRIVAVSAPLAELVGWSAEDLIGRRVVTLIPPHLREAHVAGFTRHLTTGEAHVLDVPLELPVLRADGSEVRCHFLVQRASTSGRPVYLAWIEPVGDDAAA